MGSVSINFFEDVKSARNGANMDQSIASGQGFSPKCKSSSSTGRGKQQFQN